MWLPSWNLRSSIPIINSSTSTKKWRESELNSCGLAKIHNIHKNEWLDRTVTRPPLFRDGPCPSNGMVDFTSTHNIKVRFTWHQTLGWTGIEWSFASVFTNFAFISWHLGHSLTYSRISLTMDYLEQMLSNVLSLPKWAPPTPAWQDSRIRSSLRMQIFHSEVPGTSSDDESFGFILCFL